MQIASAKSSSKRGAPHHPAITGSCRLFVYAFSLSTWWMSKSLCSWFYWRKGGCWVNPRFSDTRDEANTHVAFHTVHVEQLNPGNTVIRRNDTTILIIMLSNIQKFSQSHVWLDTGLDYNNLHWCQRNSWQTELRPSITWSILLYWVQCWNQIYLSNTFNKMREEDLIDKYTDVLESFTCSCLVTAN